MEVILKKQAIKYLNKTSGKAYTKLEKALEGLATLQGDIKYMEGSNGEYRLKIPPFRILFTCEEDKIIVERIGPRGDAYKKERMIWYDKKRISRKIKNNSVCQTR